jgi:hypothetical protein
VSRIGRRSTERKAELLAIMHTHRERATCLSDFSRKAIAQDAGVTAQYVSMLIGPEYRAACEGLSGKRRLADSSLQKALDENRRLRRELENTRQRLEQLGRQSIDDALRLIDQLDEDNRRLHGRVRILEQRLRQQEVVVTAGDAAPRVWPPLGLVPTDT